MSGADVEYSIYDPRPGPIVMIPINNANAVNNSPPKMNNVLYNPNYYLPTYQSITNCNGCIGHSGIPLNTQEYLHLQAKKLEIVFDIKAYIVLLSEVDTHCQKVRKPFNIYSRFKVGSWACMLHMLYYHGEEPACSQARDALMVISTLQVQSLDILALERRVKKGSRAHILVLALLFDNIIACCSGSMLVEESGIDSSDPGAEGLASASDCSYFKGTHVNGFDNIDCESVGAIPLDTYRRRCIELYAVAGGMGDCIARLQIGGRFVGDGTGGEGTDDSGYVRKKMKMEVHVEAMA